MRDTHQTLIAEDQTIPGLHPRSFNWLTTPDEKTRLDE